jgi:hypothetical protein
VRVWFVIVFLVAGLAAICCLDKADAEEETEARPSQEEVGEDCVRFVHATRAVMNNAPNCPTCPGATNGADVFQFDGAQVDNVSCSEKSCDVAVTIRATFNPSKGGKIAGGLTAWIPVEQREAYEHGQTPAGQQSYRAKITYRRTSSGWQMAEFDRIAAAETPSLSESGIEGIISVSPNHPGPARKDRPDTGPAPNIEFVVKDRDKTVTKFKTDSEGTFRVVLPPGHYLVTREEPGARIGHWRFEADVFAGKMTKVQWVADSGMR